MNEFVQKLDMKVLGDRLQKVRQHLKMKQSEVAEEVGCAPLTISRMERGETSTSLLPLLAFYSQSISMDLLFAKAFDPEDEALYSKDPALESHVKARLQLLQSDATEYIKNLQKEYDVNVKKLIDELLNKMNQEMLDYTSKTREDLLKRLEQTIELL
ncbi:MAG: helix-turn-helix transcriptional regulator [Prevotella sp.]|nr:helix-turn-helix transcriptional regulator [Prevotella sp.]